MVTTIELTLLLAASESATCTDTVELAGPSGKVQSKLPAPAAAGKLGVGRRALAPQLWLTRLKVSAPGSLVKAVGLEVTLVGRRRSAQGDGGRHVGDGHQLG